MRLATLYATEQAESSVARRMSPLELVDAVITRIERSTREFNPVITRCLTRRVRRAGDFAGAGGLRWAEAGDKRW